MSHEIQASDVFGEVRLNGQRAWHGLGVEIEPGLTAWEAFEKIGLDWETKLLPLLAVSDVLRFGEQGTPLHIEVPSHRAHVRSDTKEILGVVGSGYKPISNRELAEFADALVRADVEDSLLNEPERLNRHVTVETAGSLRNCRVVYALVKLPRDIEVTGEDILNQYILIRNSHDGSTSFQVYLTSVRVVCANTLRMSERDLGRGIQFRHTGDVSEKIEHARLALGLIAKESERFEAKVRVLSARHLTKDEVSEYFRTVYDATYGVVPDNGDISAQIERRDDILGIWQANFEKEEQTLQGIEGTAWAAYNAVSLFHTHQRGRYKPLSESFARVHSNLFGVSDASKQTAFKEALALASA